MYKMIFSKIRVSHLHYLFISTTILSILIKGLSAIVDNSFLYTINYSTTIGLSKFLSIYKFFFALFQPFHYLALLLIVNILLEINLQVNNTLVSSAQKGNAEALKLLYLQYNKAMFNICIRLMGNSEDAEDVLQDAFVLAFKGLNQLKETAQFAGWLKRIVINECIRQGKKRNSYSEWEEEKHDIPDEEEKSWWNDVTMVELHQQIKSLPDGCRQIFTLYAVENFSHKDIGAVMGVSEGTSKSQYHRAKQLLREKLLNHKAH